jgi:hypothetical protein
MQNEIIVAVIAFLGTLIGTLGGILASGKLTNHRLEALEKKVDKHNTVIERLYVAEEKIKANHHRILILEGECK